MKWVAVLAIIVFGVVGMTALDKYDERSCRQDARIVGRESDSGVSLPVFETCDGFLPW